MFYDNVIYTQLHTDLDTKYST